MNFYIAQEFLGVFVLVAVLTVTTLFVGIAFIVFQEVMLRARDLGKTSAPAFNSVSRKGIKFTKIRWSNHSRPKSGYGLATEVPRRTEGNGASTQSLGNGNFDHKTIHQ
jgi:hypothetical protein